MMLSSKCLALLVGIATIVMVAAKFGDRMEPRAQQQQQSATPQPTASGLTQATRSRPERMERPTTPRSPIATTHRVAAVFNKEVAGAASEQRSTSPVPNNYNSPPPGFDNNFPPNFGFKDPSFDYNYGPPAPTAATDNQYQHQSYGPNGPTGPNEPNSPPQPPPPPPSNYGSSSGDREPEFMRSLLEQFDKLAAAEKSGRDRKGSTSTSSAPSSFPSSSSSNYHDAARQPLPALPSASTRTTPPVYRSANPAQASSSSYYGPSATTPVGGSSVPNYGPSSMSDTFGPTSSYGPSNSYSSNVDHDMPTSPGPDYRRKNGGGSSAYYNQIPQPQGSGTHYSNGPSEYPPPEASSYGPPPPPPPPPEPAHHNHGPRLNHLNTQNNQHSNQNQNQNHNHNHHGHTGGPGHDHSYETGPTWPSDLPDPKKDPRAQLEEERVGGENREGKPWGHKKKYVYRDPKNGNNYMEISEVHMSMNREYKPGEDVKESASHIDRMVDTPRRFQVEPPRSFFDGLNFDSSDMNPFAAPRPPF